MHSKKKDEEKKPWYLRFRRGIVDFLYRYIILHMAYIVFSSLLLSVILYLIEKKNGKGMYNGTPTYLDHWYLSMSHITGTGLATIDISQMKVASQIFILIAMLMGSSVMLSLGPVVIRRFQFRNFFKKHKRIIHLDPNSETGLDDRLFYHNDKKFPFGVVIPPHLDPNTHLELETQKSKEFETVAASPFTGVPLRNRLNSSRSEPRPQYTSSLNPSSSSSVKSYHHGASVATYDSIADEGNAAGNREQPSKVTLTTTPTAKIVPTAVSFGEAPLLEEPLYDSIYDYCAMGQLIVIVLSYLVFWYVFGFVWLMIATYGTSDIRHWFREMDSNIPVFCIFAIVSAFNNVGSSTCPGGVLAFRGNAQIMSILALEALAGNVLFPVFLRLIIEVLKRITTKKKPKGEGTEESAHSHPAIKVDQYTQDGDDQGVPLLTNSTPTPSFSSSSFSSSSSSSSSPSSISESQLHPQPRMIISSFRPLYHFLMKRGRFCYTHLFESEHTRTLIIFFFFFVLAEFVPLLILDYRNFNQNLNFACPSEGTAAHHFGSSSSTRSRKSSHMGYLVGAGTWSVTRAGAGAISGDLLPPLYPAPCIQTQQTHFSSSFSSFIPASSSFSTDSHTVHTSAGAEADDAAEDEDEGEEGEGNIESGNPPPELAVCPIIEPNWVVRVLLALCYTINSRACGFNMLDTPILNHGTLWIVLAAMFFGPYPFIIALRGSQTVVVDKKEQRKERRRHRKELRRRMELERGGSQHRQGGSAGGLGAGVGDGVGSGMGWEEWAWENDEDFSDDDDDDDSDSEWEDDESGMVSGLSSGTGGGGGVGLRIRGREKEMEQEKDRVSPMGGTGGVSGRRQREDRDRDRSRSTSPLGPDSPSLPGSHGPRQQRRSRRRKESSSSTSPSLSPSPITSASPTTSASSAAASDPLASTSGGVDRPIDTTWVGPVLSPLAQVGISADADTDAGFHGMDMGINSGVPLHVTSFSSASGVGGVMGASGALITGVLSSRSSSLKQGQQQQQACPTDPLQPSAQPYASYSSDKISSQSSVPSLSLSPPPVKRTNVMRWKNAWKSIINFVQMQQDSHEARDLWWLLLSIFFLSLIENKQIENLSFSQFSICFDLFSAYGNCGLNMGYACIGDFDSPMETISKYIFILIMFLGKHREIPTSLDSAIDFKKFLKIPVDFDRVIDCKTRLNMKKIDVSQILSNQNKHRKGVKSSSSSSSSSFSSSSSSPFSSSSSSGESSERYLSHSELDSSTISESLI